MPVHVVGFADVINAHGFAGRYLLNTLNWSSDYKNLKPGDRERVYASRSDLFADFVAPDSFDTTLTLTKEFDYGSSYVTLWDLHKSIFYPMFKSDFTEMAFNAVINRGDVTGHFGYIKKGNNFAIKYLREV